MTTIVDNQFRWRLRASECLMRALMTATLPVESDPLTPTLELLSDLLHAERPLSIDGGDGHSWAHVRHLVADLVQLADREGDQSAFSTADFKSWLGDLDDTASLAMHDGDGDADD